MKKLMIAAAVALGAIVVNAAQINWYVYTEQVSDDFTAYVLNGATDASTLANFLISGDYADASSFNTAFGSAEKASTALDGGYGEGASYGLSGNTMSILFLKDTIEGSSVYYLDNVDVTGFTYEPGQQGPGQFPFEELAYNSGTVTYAAPEPTSGLLLLLGVAGLALRRRRA